MTIKIYTFNNDYYYYRPTTGDDINNIINSHRHRVAHNYYYLPTTNIYTYILYVLYYTIVVGRSVGPA